MPKLSFQYVRHDVPETLLDFLTRRFRYHTASEWEGLLRSGKVTVNGRRAGSQHVLETRQKIVYERPQGPEPVVDARYCVLYEDAHLLAVSKSGNIPTSPSGKYWDHCLVHVLMKDRKLPELHAVHRLDRETSGVNLFAKTKAAARRLGNDFHQGQVSKRYNAILRGRLPVRDIYVSAPLRSAEGGSVRIRQEVHPQGRDSRTRFVLRALLPGGSLVDVLPLTGRTHQIRAHAEFIGHPVWGDKLYGVPESDFLHWVANGERNSAERQLLHATELTFTHPVTSVRLTVRDPAGDLIDLFLNGVQAEGVTS